MEIVIIWTIVLVVSLVALAISLVGAHMCPYQFDVNDNAEFKCHCWQCTCESDPPGQCQ